MDYVDWWQSLEEQWQQAFTITFFQKPAPYAEADLERLVTSKVLRFAGPAAPFPNMPFALTNLSGLARLANPEVLVVTHHEIASVVALQHLTTLKSLFLFNNQIRSLKGLEALVHLEQLYLQHNEVSSLEPIKKLTRLKELYVSQNRLSGLEGLTAAHADSLQKFYCLPNEGLKQKEVLKVERRLGIRCLTG